MLARVVGRVVAQPLSPDRLNRLSRRRSLSAMLRSIESATKSVRWLLHFENDASGKQFVDALARAVVAESRARSH